MSNFLQKIFYFLIIYLIFPLYNYINIVQNEAYYIHNIVKFSLFADEKINKRVRTLMGKTGGGQ